MDPKKLKAEKGIVVVPDADRKIAGSMVFWSLSGQVDIERLLAAWRSHALDEGWLPELPTPTRALKRAVKEQRGPCRLIRPLGRSNGWCIVEENVAHNGDDLRHSTAMKVRLNPVGQIVCQPEGSKTAAEIRAAYERVLTQISHGDISGWLCRMVHKVMAVNLRPRSGGFYFVPQEHVETWEHIAAALEASSACEVHGLPVMQAASAVRAILSGINSEVATEIERMNREIPTLGERGLQTRLTECEDIESTVQFYEGFLGQTLTDLRLNLKKLKASIAAGILVANGEDVEGS